MFRTKDDMSNRDFYLATSGLRHHRGVLIRLISDKDGEWFCSADHPTDDAVLGTEVFDIPDNAIAAMRDLIDEKFLEGSDDAGDD